ncbi:unnamed protein product [Rhizoctonia solani]|uniref:Ricin B lectin domain-containing protein n=1 Tax=Rhizoctonia solani TaxID=456999 RepID=A0A8H3BYB4_9AGAM|nr:unnamed protein product [Rhizoctonia solani]
MSYERPPEPGTYCIKSVAAPKNLIEACDFNPERVVCSPQVGNAVSNQQWYIQRSGQGYKFKNVKHSVYLSPHSAQPKHGTTIWGSPSHGPVDWTLMRTHEGFLIQYGEEESAIDLHYGLDKTGNPMSLWAVRPQDSAKRWKFERISDDVGGEIAETVEDRIAVLSDQVRKKDVEIATKDAEIVTKDRLLAQKEKEVQELREALQTHHEVSPMVVRAQLAELREKIGIVEGWLKLHEDVLEQRNNTG